MECRVGERVMSIGEFDRWCGEQTFSLKDVVSRWGLEGLYNPRVKCLASMCEELVTPMREFSELCEEEDELKFRCSESEGVVREIIEKYWDGTLEICEGDDRTCFIFNNFVIKVNKNCYVTQTEDEITEYSEYLEYLADKEYSEEEYMLLPIIGILNIEGLDFLIYPRASVAIDLDHKGIVKWVRKQSEIRDKVLGEPMVFDVCDLSYGNIGMYRDRLYIIDAGCLREQVYW